jgi:alkylhydroperoxidase family enzyme
MHGGSCSPHNCHRLDTAPVPTSCPDRAAGSGPPYVTDAERVALELVEAVLTPNPFGERVPDALYAKATAHYDDKALWTLTLAISLICYVIPVALIGRPIPGMPPGRNYSR